MLKSVETDVVTNFIKDEVERSSILKLILMMTLNKIGSSDSDKMPVSSNKILVMWRGILQNVQKVRCKYWFHLIQFD